ncbi:sushi, von Willebrand factor type A, EGF and pentraxin domain-containing protein 1-like [Haliotis rufescens]|uniref:sushi, von Willebrand factor type A, EGF and pentraxin domain-containing protein 1-like n=1 Tax=Haliotis rufescens TaxID=6454 RepID=UPI00201F9E8F|nr:sushi, von Willebrand factor type A, EGF and pentraxin domain-containing protein 1-like [Haliotis rufescens]
MRIGADLVFWIFTTVVPFCCCYRCGSRLLLKPSIEPVLFPSQRMIVKNVIQCETACRRDAKCISLNYDFKNGFCDLNTFDHGYDAASSQVKYLLEKNCKVDGVDACADCPPGTRCVYAANEYACLAGEASSPLIVVDCGPPEPLHNGVFVYNTTTYTSLGTAICNSGYNLSGSSKHVTCSAEGRWETLNGSCKIVDCGVPGSIPGGSFSYSTTTYGSLGHAICNSGFNFSGSSNSVSCTAGGDWENVSGICKVVDCGVPGSIPGGSINYSTTTYGSLGHAICNSGFNFSGSNNSVSCTAGGDWENVTGICKVVECGVPGSIPGGSINYNTTTYGSLGHAICNSGFNFSGSNNSVSCTAGGDWENVTGICKVVDCGLVPNAENRLLSYNSTVFGSQVTVTCVNDTDQYDGDNTGVCDERGQWIGVPVCKKNTQSIGGWILLLRVTADVNVSPYDVWMDDLIYHDHPAVPGNLQPGCMTLDTSLPCDMHFKSKLVTTWETANIEQVKVIILKGNTVKAEVLFDGVGTTKTSWFSSSHVINSTWTDLMSLPQNRFSITGDGTTNRRFQINHYYGGCPADKGWLAVIDKPDNNPCPWEQYTSVPHILYSAGTSESLCADFESGDVMAILAKQQHSG